VSRELPQTGTKPTLAQPGMAGVRPRQLAQQAAVAGHGPGDGVLPEIRLLAEWPDGEDGPTPF
jgi:hypothetical protein